MFVLEEFYKKNLLSFFNEKLGYRNGETWKILYPDADRSVGKKALQCGPFLCFYADATAAGWSLLSAPDIREYRDHILARLIGACCPMQPMEMTRCYKCNSKITNKAPRCNFCNRIAHLSCLKRVIARGRSLNICY